MSKKGTRQASAASAAAAMERAGFSGTGFVGFDAFSGAGGFGQDEQELVENDGFVTSYYNGNDEDLKTAFRRLSKKDALTKVKALQEIVGIVEDAKAKKEEVRMGFRHFLYHYLRICSRETDHRTREHANFTLASFCKVVPKIALKHVGVFLGELLSCLADSFNGEVRKAAQVVVDGLPSDRGAWFESCLDKVGKFLATRIDGDPSAEPDMVPRLQVNALGAIVSVVELFPKDQCEQLLAKVFSGTNKWKSTILSNRNDFVRAQGFKLVEVLTRENCFASCYEKDEDLTDIVSLLSKALGKEKQSSNVANLLNALVSLMKSNENFFETLCPNYRKVLFPGLWTLFKEGACGAGAVVYPSTLPMMSLVPDSVWESYDGVLPDKWLEEMWSGIPNKEKLGPHGTPYLLEAILESMAFLRKKGRSFDHEHFLRVVRYYLDEPQRFRIGAKVPGLLSFTLAQFSEEEDEEIWGKVEALFIESYKHDRVKAVRVSEIFKEAKGGLVMLQPIASVLVQQSTHHSIPALANLLNMVSSVVDNDGAIDWSAFLESNVFPILQSKSPTNGDLEACYQVILRMMILRTMEQTKIWTLTKTYYKDETHDGPLASALRMSTQGCKEGTRLDDVTRWACVEHPRFKPVAVLKQIGWMDDELENDLAQECKQMIEQYVSAIFERKENHAIDANNVVSLIELLQKGPEEGSILTGLGFIAACATGKPSKLVPDSKWLESWLLAQFQANQGIDWVKAEVPPSVWAKVAVKANLVETLLNHDRLLFEPSLEKRLVSVCMHISEQFEEGECLGFEEPGSLLWVLLRISSRHEPDWRDAVLVPYIVGKPTRFADVFQHGLSKQEVTMESASTLLDGANAFGVWETNNYLHDLLWSWLTKENIDLVTFSTMVQKCAPVLQKHQLMAKLTRISFDRLMKAFPSEGKKSDAEAKTSAFLSLVMNLEKTCENHQNNDDEGENSDETPPNTPPPSSPAEAEIEAEEEERFEKGEAIYYAKDPNQQTRGVVVGVHLDDPTAPYYTIKLEGDGRELQTTAKYLKPKLVKPKTLAELNQLLAAARRAGDHKESLRLMKLQPSLLPKPVDTDMVRRQKLEAARKRRENALEEMAQAKRKGNGETGAATSRTLNTASTENDGVGEEVEKPKKLSQDAWALLLQHFAACVNAYRGVKLENEELHCLLVICHCLDEIMRPSAIAPYLRTYHPGDPFLKQLKATLSILASLLKNIRMDALSNEIQVYVERVVLTCLMQGKKDVELVNLSAGVIEFVPSEEPMMERALETCFDLVVDSYNEKYSDTMIRMLEEVPVKHIEDKEDKAGLIKTLVNLPESVGHRLLKLFGKCCQESDDLARIWWVDGSKEILMEKAFHHKDLEDDDEVASPIAWMMFLHIVRRIRLLVPDERESIPEMLESSGMVDKVLHWSLLADHLEEDHREVASQTLRVLPAVCRRWYSDSSKVSRGEYALIKHRMAKSISPVIIDQEMLDIQAADKTHLFDVDHSLQQESAEAGEEVHFGTVRIATSRVSRIVTAIYEKEDCSVEINVELPTSFPLTNVIVTCPRQIGIKRERWSHLLIRLTALLTSQDGTVLDAVLLWKQYMDKEFQGLEPCPICFAVVQANDQTLPKLQCSTCKNSFHSKCLGKWFRTSHKNDCPLCKQPF